MKRQTKAALILLPVFFALSSCAEYVGDFCDLAEPMTTRDKALAETIVDRDPLLAQKMNVQNELLARCP